MGVITLPLDLDIFLRSGSRIQPLMEVSRHGSVPCSKWARSTVEESQVLIISGPGGPQVHRERGGEEVRVVPPAASDLRGERGGGPGVHDVGVAGEAAGLP